MRKQYAQERVVHPSEVTYSRAAELMWKETFVSQITQTTTTEHKHCLISRHSSHYILSLYGGI